MALGYTQGYSTVPYSTVPYQATAQAVPGANIATPSNGNTYYHLVSQVPNPGANLTLNTTYIGARKMTYARDNDFQHGAPHNLQGLHFQPPVPDTTYGPMTHTYVPRHDGGVMPQVAAIGGPLQVCYPHYYAAHVPVVTTRPATALIPVAHVSIMPSGTLYASRLIRAAPFVLLLWYLFGWELEVLAWVVALLYLFWLLVSDVNCYGLRDRVAIINTQSSQVPLQPQAAPSHTLTVHHQAPVPAFQPQVASQPAVYFGGQTMPGSYPVQVPPMCATAPAFPGVPGVAGVPGSVTAHLPPDVMGVGKTIAEIQAHHHDIAMTNGMHEPEDFQPTSKDPAKMYYCRELDGNWTQRSRYSIDKMGDWRWYQTPEGVFYAVRLPN